VVVPEVMSALKCNFKVVWFESTLKFEFSQWVCESVRWLGGVSLHIRSSFKRMGTLSPGSYHFKFKEVIVQ